MKKEQIIKILPLGGQAEHGKSMYCIEIDDRIYIIDCGYRFPEVDKLGVDIIIPDFSYIVENKKRLKGIIITHGHNDVMSGLPYLLELVGAPVYASNLTSDLIEQMISIYNKQNHKKIPLNIHRIENNSQLKIAGVVFDFFQITHSIPGSLGVAVLTKYGYIVYAGEFIIDFGAPKVFGCDIQKMMEIAKKGVLALLCESSYAKNEGYTSPKHKLTDKIEHIFEDAQGRIIISSYAQNIFRTTEIVNLTKKYRRKIVFYGRDKNDRTNSVIRIASQLKQADLKIQKHFLGTSSDIGKAGKDEKLVVLLSGDPRVIYHDILDVVNGGDEKLKLNKNDNFIIASPVLPGTEKIANQAINELYKTDTKITVLKSASLFSMHASQEDIKVILQIFKPKYYIPIKGEYQHFVANQNIAVDLGTKPQNIAIIDNGEILTFKNGKMESYRDTIQVEDVMIDGSGIGDVGDKVIDDRIQLSKDGVVVIGATIDSKTRKMVTSIDIQTRGFVYLKDSTTVIKGIEEISTKVLEELSADPNLEIIEVRTKIRDKVNKYIIKETGKRPVILPVIIEL